MLGQLDGRIAIVTGGTGAIGGAIAEKFQTHGACVWICDTDAESTQSSPAKARESSTASAINFRLVDVRDSRQVKLFIDEVDDRHHRIDILVNNAAVTLIKPVDELADSEIDNIISTNLKGYICFSREVVRVMKRRRIRGSILNISSKNGLEGAADKVLYSMTKGAQIVMARSLAKELGPYGIRVNTICPDAVVQGSKLWKKGGAYSLATSRRYNIEEDEICDYYKNRSSLRVNITSEDVANAALFLVSDDAGKMTGNILTVDGGIAYVR